MLTKDILILLILLDSFLNLLICNITDHEHNAREMPLLSISGQIHTEDRLLWHTCLQEIIIDLLLDLHAIGFSAADIRHVDDITVVTMVKKIPRHYPVYLLNAIDAGDPAAPSHRIQGEKV